MSLTPADARVFALCKSLESVLIGHCQGDALCALLMTTRAILIEAQSNASPPDSVIALLLLIDEVGASLMDVRADADEMRH